MLDVLSASEGEVDELVLMAFWFSVRGCDMQQKSLMHIKRNFISMSSSSILDTMFAETIWID